MESPGIRVQHRSESVRPRVSGRSAPFQRQPEAEWNPSHPDCRAPIRIAPFAWVKHLGYSYVCPVHRTEARSRNCIFEEIDYDFPLRGRYRASI